MKMTLNNFMPLMWLDNLTIPQFAKLKGVSRTTVYSAIKRKEIDSVYLYGKLLIPSNKKSKNYKSPQGVKKV